ncbi:MAG: FMN-binding protein [Spirochaetales bacterium]|nr:FMN-binding protein [Spirochaetales bacterium]
MKDIIKMLLFVIIMGTILSTAIVGVDSWTSPLIAKNNEIKIKTSVLKALGLEYTKDTIELVFSNKITTKDAVINDNQVKLYYSPDNTVAFQYQGAGLWGDIIGILAVNAQEDSISRVSIFQQEETPGLGSRIGDDAYLNQYIGKVFDPEISSKASSEKSKVDVITGATLSSEAFIKILNEEYSKYKNLLKGVK